MLKLIFSTIFFFFQFLVQHSINEILKTQSFTDFFLLIKPDKARFEFPEHCQVLALSQFLAVSSFSAFTVAYSIKFYCLHSCLQHQVSTMIIQYRIVIRSRQRVVIVLCCEKFFRFYNSQPGTTYGMKRVRNCHSTIIS